jgi:hypothetical protein
VQGSLPTGDEAGNSPATGLEEEWGLQGFVFVEAASFRFDTTTRDAITVHWCNMHDVLGGISANCSGAGDSTGVFKNPDAL